MELEGLVVSDGVRSGVLILGVFRDFIIYFPNGDYGAVGGTGVRSGVLILGVFRDFIIYFPNGIYGGGWCMFLWCDVCSEII